MKLRSALVAASLLALPAAAIAQPVDGLYVGAGAGYNYLQDQSVKSGGSGNVHGGGGFIGLASVGYGFGNGLRVELQGDYRNSDHNGGGFGGSTNQTYGAFVNGLFDFDVGSDVVYPYAGVGLGFEHTHEQRAQARGRVLLCSSTLEERAELRELRLHQRHPQCGHVGEMSIHRGYTDARSTR